MDSIYIMKYELNDWIAKYFPKKDLISIDDLITVIEDLDSEVDRIKEEFEEYKQNIKENYKPISSNEMYDINERDFH